MVAIDPSAAFREAITTHLPHAAVSVDAFHLVQLANQALTAVRQRRAREVHDRRGCACDPTWANRRLLLRAADTLSTRAWTRLEHVFALDDPSGQLEWAWAVKKHGELVAQEADAVPVQRSLDRPSDGEHSVRDADLALAYAEHCLDELQGVER